MIESRYQSRHVVGDRRLPFERAPRRGMGQRQTRRMERLARKGTECRRQRGTASCGQPTPAAVYRIADDGIPDMRKVHAYLVGPASLELHPHECMGAIARDDAIVSDCLASITSYRHARTLRTMASYGRIDGPPTRHRTTTYREVGTLYLALRQCSDESRMRLGRARHDEQAARVRIE